MLWRVDGLKLTALVGGGSVPPAGPASNENQIRFVGGQTDRPAPELAGSAARHRSPSSSDGAMDVIQSTEHNSEGRIQEVTTPSFHGQLDMTAQSSAMLNPNPMMGRSADSQGERREQPEGQGSQTERMEEHLLGEEENQAQRGDNTRGREEDENQGYDSPDNTLPFRPNHQTRRQLEKQQRKSTKAGLNGVSLNLNGYRGTGPHQKGNRWTRLNTILKENRIGIAIVQETHMTEPKRAQTEHVFHKQMKIFASNHPTNPTTAGGVAVVLNKQFLPTTGAESEEIVPGRALLVKTDWHRGDQITVLAIYAPNVTANDGTESAAFWEELRSFFERPENRQWRPDLVAGDFNMVEDAIDRLPMRNNPYEMRDKLDDLKMELRICDGWRNTYPADKVFTFSRNESQSRLDCIYVTDKLLQSSSQWRITPVGTDGVDHEMVSVRVAHEDAPKIGRGRWSMSTKTLRNKDFRAFAKQRGCQAVEEIDALPDITRKAREIERTQISEYQQEISRVQREIQQIGSTSGMNKRTRAGKIHGLKKQLKTMKSKGNEARKRLGAAKDRLIGKTICKEWKSHKTQLQIRTNPSSLECKLAKDYHEQLQTKGLDQDPQQWEQATVEVLGYLDAKLSEAQKEYMGENLAWEEVAGALKLSKTGSSAGINGTTYKFWKSMADAHRTDSKKEDTAAFDVVKLLTEAFVDIQNHGVDNTTKFAEGWMCPIYKKGDRNVIANY
ncbi:Endonuclease/exonuclease/phosphatase [Lentinula edodes]|nr:Endonuclease/exonuclease/phosphatase [Lentinula edodes]